MYFCFMKVNEGRVKRNFPVDGSWLKGEEDEDKMEMRNGPLNQTGTSAKCGEPLNQEVGCRLELKVAVKRWLGRCASFRLPCMAPITVN